MKLNNLVIYRFFCVIDYLGTEICSSKRKKFPLLTFIDTPGLVDGDMVYPFDVNKALVWMGSMVDLVFVFFDPIGQALCKRTLNIVDKINASHPERVKFYLTKTDEAGDEGDRQRVLMQIVQELCKRPGLNRAGFDMPTIFIPDETISRRSKCLNQISKLTEEVERAINLCVQNTLENMEKDCDRLAEVIDEKVQIDTNARNNWWRDRCYGLFYALFTCFLLPVGLSIYLVAKYSPDKMTSFLHDALGPNAVYAQRTYSGAIDSFWNLVPQGWGVYVVSFLLIIVIILSYLTKRAFRPIQMLSRADKSDLMFYRNFVQATIKEIKHKLYQEYLEQSITDK